MTRGKDVYHGTLECFTCVLICHVPVFHVLQLDNKLQKVDMFCLAHHLDIFFGLKWACGLIMYASYIFNMFIYISYSDKWQYIVKNKCKIHKKHHTFGFAAARATSLLLHFYITGTLSFFLTHRYPQSTTYAFICGNR
jgi:hypothetical protein